MSTEERRRAADDPFVMLNLLGESPIFRDVLRVIDRVAPVDATVLIQGETGTGKELAARAVHYLSPRKAFPFIPVNCGALPDGLLESELFGHERGAFTDARAPRRGLVTQAEGGTLFLDEVEAMTPRGQGVLLRFLQDRSYRPVGGSILKNGNVRVIASSNVDLTELVRRNQFRRDLLFRFDILSIHMPPLRDRRHDVLLLAEHFLQRFAVEHQRPPRRLDRESIDWLLTHDWPGNVRELENLILREFLLAETDVIRIARLGHQASAAHSAGDAVDEPFQSAKARAIAEFEQTYLRGLLTRTCGNVSLAARISRKDRSALNKLVKKHGIAADMFRSPSS